MSTTKTAHQNYEKWVDAYADDLYRFAHRLCGQPAEAEDLVQETFYHAWRSMGTLIDPSRARSWLFQILRYRHAHWIRARSRRPQTTGAVDAGDRSERGMSPLEHIAMSDALQHALDELPEHFREPFLRVFWEGQTCQETASALGIPIGTVLSRIHRARQALRKRLRHADGATQPLHSSSGSDRRPVAAAA